MNKCNKQRLPFIFGINRANSNLEVDKQSINTKQYLDFILTIWFVAILNINMDIDSVSKFAWKENDFTSNPHIKDEKQGSAPTCKPLGNNSFTI